MGGAGPPIPSRRQVRRAGRGQRPLQLVAGCKSEPPARRCSVGYAIWESPLPPSDKMRHIAFASLACVRVPPLRTAEVSKRIKDAKMGRGGSQRGERGDTRPVCSSVRMSVRQPPRVVRGLPHRRAAVSVGASSAAQCRRVLCAGARCARAAINIFPNICSHFVILFQLVLGFFRIFCSRFVKFRQKKKRLSALVQRKAGFSPLLYIYFLYTLPFLFFVSSSYKVKHRRSRRCFLILCLDAPRNIYCSFIT